MSVVVFFADAGDCTVIRVASECDNGGGCGQHGHVCWDRVCPHPRNSARRSSGEQDFGGGTGHHSAAVDWHAAIAT